MKKKRSVGVTVFGVVGIAIGLWIIIGFAMLSSFATGIYTTSSCVDLLVQFFYAILALGFTVCGASILTLRHWARILFLSFMGVYSLLGLVPLYFVTVINAAYGGGIIHIGPLMFFLGVYLVVFGLPTVLSFIFFTRPKVKEQFKKEARENGARPQL